MVITAHEFVSALKAHWLTGVECDHRAKTDVASCACGWVSDKELTVGAAVEAWAWHVVDKI